MAKIIVYIAQVLTPCSDGEISRTGHAFFGFDYGNGLIETYGLHPTEDGTNGISGQIRQNDYYYYQVENNLKNGFVKQYEFEVSDWEFNNLRDWCISAVANPPWYDAPNSDCITWVYQGLEYDGISSTSEPPHWLPGNNEVNLQKLEYQWIKNHDRRQIKQDSWHNQSA